MCVALRTPMYLLTFMLQELSYQRHFGLTAVCVPFFRERTSERLSLILEEPV